MTNLLFIALGSNIGERLENLEICIELISSEGFKIVEASSVYESKAVDYLEQDDFLNQVLHLEHPKSFSSAELLSLFQSVETRMERKKIIDKGPRNIDIDILFFGTERVNNSQLTLPHPGIFTRSFFATPLRELKSSLEILRHFEIPEDFDNICWKYTKQSE